MKPPPIQWTRTPDDVKLAYQIVGNGPIDVIFCSPNQPNLDILWEEPGLERFFGRIASFARLIIYNQRGSGISGGAVGRSANYVEDQATDLQAILDAAGSHQAALFSIESGGFPAMLFAATTPGRIRAMVLVNPIASFRRHSDYPWGFPDEALERFVDATVSAWGTGEILSAIAPELYTNDRFRESYARFERLSNSPDIMESFVRYSVTSFDVRGILGTIQTPTLVISHTQHPFIRLGHGRYVAEHIPGARYLERDRFWGLYSEHDVDWVLDETKAFLTGIRGGVHLDDRVLATVLFTDIVSSTERAAQLGDAAWRRLLDEHDRLTRHQIELFRGRALKSTGDGVMATFDGPARAIRCAAAVREAVSTLGIEIRTGLHTGEVEQRGEDVGGIAVHIGARVMAEAGANEILVSSAVPPLVAGSGLEFEDRGVRALKGVPGEWRLYSVKA